VGKGVTNGQLNAGKKRARGGGEGEGGTGQRREEAKGREGGGGAWGLGCDENEGKARRGVGPRWCRVLSSLLSNAREGTKGPKANDDTTRRKGDGMISRDGTRVSAGAGGKVYARREQTVGRRVPQAYFFRRVRTRSSLAPVISSFL